MATLEISGKNGFKGNSLNIIEDGVLIIYGNGYDLGDFKQFAESLKKDKQTDYKKENIVMASIQNKNTLIDYLAKFSKFKIL